MIIAQRRPRPAASSAGSAIRLLVIAAGLLLAACDAVVQVTATANVPAQFSSVMVTVKEVWFNASATAVPSDTTWEKFPLKDTRTIDLAAITGGQLADITGNLTVPAGTYRQIRLVLASRDEALHDSAEELDAIYNNQVTWFDEEGDEVTLPLEVLNTGQGIGIGMELEVVEAMVGFGTGTASTHAVLLSFDAARDLTRFRHGEQNGFLLNPTIRAYSADDAGTIRGALNLSQLVIDTPTGRPAIQVTAQKLDRDLERRVVIASTGVSPTGTFVLYPLPLDEDEATTEYDLVIHGPRIQTIVIRDVPVTQATPGSATPVALGSLVLQPATAYKADLGPGDAVLPRGARIGFYQTLPGEDDPHLIGLATIDPLNGRLAEPVELSRANIISYGTFGPGFTLNSGTPGEGAARYAVAALSPQYGHGAFAATTLRPASSASDTASFDVPGIAVPAPALPGMVSAAVTVESPARYDRGALLVTNEGAVVTAASLDELLQLQLGTAFIEVQPVPAGSASATLAQGLYHLEAWTWNSEDPDSTFARHPGADAVDLRSIATAGGALTIQQDPELEQTQPGAP